ncbi:hypothetical protein M3899_003164 [Vibrio parahaemolyticus]|nr:hypothetical protein [Vibrio parahaemolyticus]
MKHQPNYVKTETAKFLIYDSLMKGMVIYAVLFVVLLVVGMAYTSLMTSTAVSALLVCSLVYLICKGRIYSLEKKMKKNCDLLLSKDAGIHYYQVTAISGIGLNLSTQTLVALSTSSKDQRSITPQVIRMCDIDCVKWLEPEFTHALDPVSPRTASLVTQTERYRWNATQRAAALRSTGLLIAFKDIVKEDIFIHLQPEQISKWYKLLNDVASTSHISRPGSPTLLP